MKHYRETRRKFETERHVHRFGEQPGGKCMCGQIGVLGRVFCVRKPAKENEHGEANEEAAARSHR